MRTTKNIAVRFWELDALRGVALVGMIIFHLLFDVVWLGWVSVDLRAWYWVLVQTGAAVLFLGLMGMGLSLKFAQLEKRGMSEHDKIKAFAKRVGWLSGWAALITVVTFIVVPALTIWFGILHCLALTTLLTVPLLFYQRWRWWRASVLVLAVGCLVGGYMVSQYTVSTPWWLWLGLQTPTFASLDYFPLLPWWGVVLAGVWVASRWYPNTQRGWEFSLSPGVGTRFLAQLGRHSLLIYLIHQPVILAGLWLVKNMIQ